MIIPWCFKRYKHSVKVGYDFVLKNLRRRPLGYGGGFVPQYDLEMWWFKNMPYHFRAKILGSWDEAITTVEILFKSEEHAMLFRLKWL